jgi:methionyl-tRNA synthetase
VSRFYITTPIYYTNAAPHLGHAYTTMLADAIARAHQLLGEDVFFLTGTDEHGQKIERSAVKAGVDTRAYVDRLAGEFKTLFSSLNVSNDDFIRTSEPRHYRASEAIWRRVEAAGDLYKGTYEGWYCTVDEVFVPETQLVDGRCPDCGNPVEKVREESYFFRLSKYEQPLLEHYRAHPDFVSPDIRRNEVVSFVEQGLKDLSVSRTSFRWGIPVPGDPAHVMYVWFDALTNYLTAVGFGDESVEARERFARWWPADVHIIGKEILRQHAVYWPAFLMSAGLPLPRRVVAHGWWLMEGAKMSKSVGNVVRPDGYVERFGVDALRYFVLREMTVGNDASFTDEAFIARYNADLANDLGNLVSRTVAMLHRYCDGRVPEPGLPDEAEGALADAARRAIKTSVDGAARLDLSEGLASVWAFIGEVNRYLVRREPWKLAKDASARPTLDRTLYHAADAIRVVAALIDPAMPETANRIRRMLGVSQEPWTNLALGTLKPNTALGSAEPLFPRWEPPVTENQPPPASPQPQAASPQPTATSPQPPATSPQPPIITISDFGKVDLRVARVLAAERVPKSKKLMKLRVDVGEERTLVAGIAEAYEPDALVGRHVVIVFNLQPATLMGVESNGMVLAASHDDGRPELLTLENPPKPGTRVR